jgi:1,4-dihydroxy-2-naphthoate octaprenyltransferase
LARCVAATRPSFLVVTLAASLLGVTSAAASDVRIDPVAATLALVFALVAHAGVNVLNDYFDARNGSDAGNSERLFPFTGGSRLIQNGVLSMRATGILGYLLLASVIPAGVWLAARSTPELIFVGLAGLLVGWAYSAPPLQLASRGLGEIAVICGWTLIVIGTDLVQRGRLAFAPLAAGLAFALLVANLLYINQFPDVRADARAGKRTVVVRLGVARARWGYGALAVLAALWILACALTRALPPLALLSLLPLVFSGGALRRLWRCANRPAQLRPAIRFTILAALAHALLLCLVLALS